MIINLIEPKDAAEMMGIKPLTLWRWARKGRIESICKTKSKALYYREEIEREAKKYDLDKFKLWKRQQLNNIPQIGYYIELPSEITPLPKKEQLNNVTVKELITRKEALEISGVKNDTLMFWVTSGEIKAYGKGKKRMFFRMEIENKTKPERLRKVREEHLQQELKDEDLI